MDPEGRPRGREGDQRGALTAAGDLYLPASHESSRVFKVTRSSLRSVWLLMSNLLNTEASSTGFTSLTVCSQRRRRDTGDHCLTQVTPHP